MNNLRGMETLYSACERHFNNSKKKKQKEESRLFREIPPEHTIIITIALSIVPEVLPPVIFHHDRNSDSSAIKIALQSTNSRDLASSKHFQCVVCHRRRGFSFRVKKRPPIKYTVINIIGAQPVFPNLKSNVI